MLGVLGRHVLLGVLLELDKIKIVAAIFHRRGFGQRGGRADEHGQARRHRERLLRSGQQHIDPQLVEFNLGTRSSN